MQDEERKGSLMFTCVLYTLLHVTLEGLIDRSRRSVFDLNSER